MSINIATRGMFQSCCGGGAVSAGGAPPFPRERNDIPKPRIVVTNVRESIGKHINTLENISIRLIESSED